MEFCVHPLRVWTQSVITSYPSLILGFFPWKKNQIQKTIGNQSESAKYKANYLRQELTDIILTPLTGINDKLPSVPGVQKVNVQSISFTDNKLPKTSKKTRAERLRIKTCTESDCETF